VSIVEARQDTLMPRAQVQRMREGLPQAQFVAIDGAGHAGLIEQGPKMVEAVRALLAVAESPGR
jgi:pimeloyl-ACP methyl ester carboxylesterase